MRLSTVVVVVVVFVALTRAERTSEWHPIIFNVPFGQAISRLLVSTQAPSAAAYVAFFVNGHGWTFYKYFTIAGGHDWHIIDIVQPKNSATVVMGPVAGINEELKPGRLAHVAVKSREPVHWVFCSYSCTLPPLPPSPAALCPTTTTTSGGNSLLIATTASSTSVSSSTNSSSSSSVSSSINSSSSSSVSSSSINSSSSSSVSSSSTIVSSSRTSNSSVSSVSSSSTITALGVLCVLLALTTITLVVYVCYFGGNTPKTQQHRLTDSPRGVTSQDSRHPLRQKHYSGGEGLGANSGQGTKSCQGEHETNNVYSQYTELGATCANSEVERGYFNRAINEGDDDIRRTDHGLRGKEESSSKLGEEEGGTEGCDNHGTVARYSKRSSLRGSADSVYDVAFH
nr:vitellogenin-1-like isoform X2 [Procambarus clarkii]